MLGIFLLAPRCPVSNGGAGRRKIYRLGKVKVLVGSGEDKMAQIPGENDERFSDAWKGKTEQVVATFFEDLFRFQLMMTARKRHETRADDGEQGE